MINVPEIRERIADHLEKTLADDSIVYSTEYQPVLELSESETAIVIQPVSMTAAFVDRARYSVEPKISITVMRRLGEDREDTADAVLEIVGKVINAVLGIGFLSAVVKGVEINDPIIGEGEILQQNCAVSRLILSLYGMENRS